jgi:hypothetical protein
MVSVPGLCLCLCLGICVCPCACVLHVLDISTKSRGNVFRVLFRLISVRMPRQDFINTVYRIGDVAAEGWGEAPPAVKATGAAHSAVKDYTVVLKIEYVMHVCQPKCFLSIPRQHNAVSDLRTLRVFQIIAHVANTYRLVKVGVDTASGLRCSLLEYEVSNPDGEFDCTETELNVFPRGSAKLLRLADLAAEAPYMVWKQHLHCWTVDESTVPGCCSINVERPHTLET